MKVQTIFANQKRAGRQLMFSAGLVATVLLISVAVKAQTIDPSLRPDLQRALATRSAGSGKGRANGYIPAPAGAAKTIRLPSSTTANIRTAGRSSLPTAHPSATLNLAATSPIPPGTPLTQILHTSQLSLSSSAGTHEQLVDRNGDLVADERTTFDSDGGSFDVAVGRSRLKVRSLLGDFQQ